MILYITTTNLCSVGAGAVRYAPLGPQEVVLQLATVKGEAAFDLLTIHKGRPH